MIKKFILYLLIVPVIITAGCISANKTNVNTEDPEKAYQTAKKSYDDKDYLQAIEDFSFIKIKFSGSSVSDKSQYYLGMSYYKRGDYILAAYEFENMIRNFTSSEFYPDARFNLAMCYYELSPNYDLDQTYTKYAITEFQNFMVLFPKHKDAELASIKIKELRNKLAFKEIKSADLYMTMGDYRAALVYYDIVLKDYFDTDYVDNAAYGRINALIAKKKYSDAKDEMDKFIAKYKESEFYNAVVNLRKKY